jgi:hypothetical protein
MGKTRMFELKISTNFVLEVEGQIRGSYEPQTLEYPGSQPWIEVHDLPFVPNGMTEDEIQTKLEEKYL